MAQTSFTWSAKKKHLCPEEMARFTSNGPVHFIEKSWLKVLFADLL
jgi:hypothetical protein